MPSSHPRFADYIEAKLRNAGNGGANQQWNVNADGTIIGVQSGICLDVTGSTNPNGSGLELWGCNGGANQRWTLGTGVRIP